ncbi:MAG: hypothetical protein LBQ20_04390 [Rhodanobacter sp.]|jgi:hypothetical protein|nr:hypothetical protein [Rhodanobacter sp.]
MTLPRDREQDLDRLLAEGGGEFGALYRRLSRVDPPRRLDRAVLGEAARALHGYQPRRRRWLVGFGSAAGMLLAIGIAWHIGQDALREQMRRNEPRVVPVEPVTAPAQPDHAHADMSASPSPEAIPSQAKKPVPAAQEAVPPPPPPPPPAAKSLPATVNESAGMMRAIPAPAPPSQAPISTPFPAAAAKAEKLTAPAATSAPLSKDRSRASTDAAAAAAPPPETTATAQRAATMPAQWLDRIHQLVHDGHTREAAESLRRFQQAYPEVPIPDDLRALLN